MSQLRNLRLMGVTIGCGASTPPSRFRELQYSRSSRDADGAFVRMSRPMPRVEEAQVNIVAPRRHGA